MNAFTQCDILRKKISFNASLREAKTCMTTIPSNNNKDTNTTTTNNDPRDISDPK